MVLKVFIHQDGPGYWSEVAELPGCFASGRTLSEQRDALAEAVGLYLWDAPAILAPEDLALGALEVSVEPLPGTPPR